MFGTRRYFWQHSCFRKLQFLLLHQFCRFLNFKNLSSPELALFQGAYSQNLGILSHVTSVYFINFLQLKIFETFTFSKSFEDFLQLSPWSDKVLTMHGKLRICYFLFSDSETCIYLHLVSLESDLFVSESYNNSLTRGTAPSTPPSS